MSSDAMTSDPHHLGEDEFMATYKPRTSPRGEHEGSMWEHAETLDQPLEHVWTVMENDDGCGATAQAGYHFVNRLFYLVTEVPWVTGDESGVWWDPDYHAFVAWSEDPEYCEQCNREEDDAVHAEQD